MAKNAFMCVLCGASYTDQGEHEKSEQHQRAGASLAVGVADDGTCPYCAPERGPKGRTRWPPLKDCTNVKHAVALAECRKLLAGKGGD